MNVYAISDLHLSFTAQKPMDIFRRIVIPTVKSRIFSDISTKESKFNYKYCSSEDTIKALWEATIKLPFEFLLKIESLINAKFDEYCSQSYIDYLESKRLEWIENFKKDILKP